MSTERNADHGEDSNTSTNHEPGKDRGTTIIVNGRERLVHDKELDFNAVAALGFETVPTGENVLVTITYRRGHGDKPEGNLLPGGTVKIKDGMVFVVTATDKS
jgi:hypothetical protein